MNRQDRINRRFAQRLLGHVHGGQRGAQGRCGVLASCWGTASAARSATGHLPFDGYPPLKNKGNRHGMITTELPIRRSDLVIRPFGENGRYVVKDPGSGSYFQIGEQEHFLLLLLDGEHDADTVCRRFELQFAEPLSAEDLDGFLALARKRQLVREAAERELQPSEERIRPPRQSILYWRTSLFDPDRFCTWLEPQIRFLGTRTFLIFSAGCILLASGLLWAERAAAATSAVGALRWETILAVWLTLFVVTMLHEFAHGLTCKHFGGEVHEIGFFADVFHALLLLQCVRCVAVSRSVEAAVGHVRGRLFRSLSLGAGRLCLAA
jgi:hypothetical protein